MNRKLIVRILCIILAFLMIFSLLTVVVPRRAYADELDDLKQKKASAENRVATIQEELEKLKGEEGEVIKEKLALEELNAAALEEIESINKQIAYYDALIEEKGREVTEAQKKEQQQLELFRARVRAMEENGDMNILAIILNADSVSSLLAAIDDYGDVMDSDKTLYNQLIQARVDLENKQKEFQELKANCETEKAKLVEEQKALEKQIEQAQTRLEELKKEIADKEEEAKAAEAELSAASASVENFIRNFTPATNENYDYSVLGTGSFVWPFPASYRISSTMKTRWGRAHNGVDIDGAGASGCPIVAADGGTVILAEWYGAYGNCVIIDHNNGYKTLYGHMSSLSVYAGQSVSSGQTIGIVGMTGSATGEHLHFEVFINGSRVNPLDFYNGYELEPGADASS